MRFSKVPKAFIGLGSNLGDEIKFLQKAVQRLISHDSITLLKTSSVYKTSPVDSEGDDYLNAVISIDTELSPNELLKLMQKIEFDLGRERPYKNAPRTIDLDLLLYEEFVLETQFLTLPHPRMAMRAFVLVPLREISPSEKINGVAIDFYISQLPPNQKIHKTNYCLKP